MDINEYVEMELLIAGELFCSKNTLLEKWFGHFQKTQRTLVGLGFEDDYIGAGKIFKYESDWFEAFQLLAHFCPWILVVPSYHQGTVKEIKWLLSENLAPKCVFLMPAENTDPDTIGNRLNIANEWTRTRNYWKPTLELPEFQNKGLMFTLNKDKSIRDIEPLIPRDSRGDGVNIHVYDYAFQYRLNKLFSARDGF